MIRFCIQLTQAMPKHLHEFSFVVQIILEFCRSDQFPMIEYILATVCSWHSTSDPKIYWFWSPASFRFGKQATAFGRKRLCLWLWKEFRVSIQVYVRPELNHFVINVRDAVWFSTFCKRSKSVAEKGFYDGSIPSLLIFPTHIRATKTKLYIILELMHLSTTNWLIALRCRPTYITNSSPTMSIVCLLIIGYRSYHLIKKFRRIFIS